LPLERDLLISTQQVRPSCTRYLAKLELISWSTHNIFDEVGFDIGIGPGSESEADIISVELEDFEVIDMAANRGTDGARNSNMSSNQTSSRGGGGGPGYYYAFANSAGGGVGANASNFRGFNNTFAFEATDDGANDEDERVWELPRMDDRMGSSSSRSSDYASSPRSAGDPSPRLPTIPIGPSMNMYDFPANYHHPHQHQLQNSSSHRGSSGSASRVPYHGSPYLAGAAHHQQLQQDRHVAGAFGLPAAAVNSGRSVTLSSSSLDGGGNGWAECGDFISFDLGEFERSAFLALEQHGGVSHGVPAVYASSAPSQISSARDFFAAAHASLPLSAQNMPALTIVGDDVLAGNDNSSSGSESSHTGRKGATAGKRKAKRRATTDAGGSSDSKSRNGSKATAEGKFRAKRSRSNDESRVDFTQFPTFGFSVNDYSFEGAGGSGIVSSHGSASDLSIYGATTSATTNDSPTPQGTAGSKTASPVPDGDAEVLGFINSILLPLGEGDFEALDAAVSRVCASDCILRTQKLKSGSSPTVDKVVPRQEISSYFKSVVDRYPDCSWHVETTKIRKGKPRSVVSSFNFKGTYLASVRNKFDAIFSPSNAEYTEQLLTENPNANLAISAIGTFILTLNKDRTVSLLDIVYLAEATASKCDD
jgi:hypothetical protein